MYFRTEALSLVRYDFKERAGRYVLLTRELGRIEARMEGARNVKSKLSPKAEPVSVIDGYLVKGKVGYTLIQVELLKRFTFRTPEQWAFVFHFIESLVKLVPEEIVEYDLFEHAKNVFEYVERGEKLYRGVWGYVYVLVLEHLGYFPGNLILEQSQRELAERVLSVGFDRGIAEMKSSEQLISLVLQTVKELLQTEHKSGGFLREVMNHGTRGAQHGII